MPGIRLTQESRIRKVAKPRRAGIPPTARRTRSATTAARRESPVSPPTPRATPPPAATPTTTTTTSSASNNTRCSDTINSSYTTSIPATPQVQQQRPQQQQQQPQPQQERKPEDGRQPTVNWDCVSYVVSDQKVRTSYEKPEMAPPVVDARTGKTTTRVASYGKMVTKTVTMTVTTTIATTEILRPGEDGYEESLERQRRQQEQTPEERDRQHQQYRESRQWASGDKTLHDSFHCRHHRSAQPAPASCT